MNNTRLLLIICTLIALKVYALETTNYPIKHLSIENGLTQSDVTSIIQDKTGFLWFATHNGLNRYDGYKIIRYKHSFDPTRSSLSDNVISSLAIDSANCIWVVNKKGIDRFNLLLNSFEHYSIFNNNGESIPLKNISKVYCSSENDLFVCMQNYLCIYEHNSDQFIPHVLTKMLPDSQFRILDIQSNTSINSIFLATTIGVFQYNTLKKTLIKHSDESSNIIYYISMSSTLLYMTKSGLTLKNLITGKTENLCYKNIPIKAVSALLFDSQTNLWIGTKSKLFIWNNGEVKESSKAYYTDHYNSVLSLFEDKANNIWIGKAIDGVTSVTLVSNIFNCYNNFNRGNLTPAIYAIYTENKDSIWFGTKEGKLHLLDRKKNAIKTVKHVSLEKVNAICPHFNTDLLWLGGTHGLYIYNKKTNKISQANAFNKCGYIASFYLDKDSTLWCAARNGLFAFKNDQMKKVYPLKEDLDTPKSACRTIFIDKDTIWAGFSSRGIIKIVKRGNDYDYHWNEYKNLNNADVSVIRKNSQGNLLIGTWGGGVNILKGDKIEYLTEDNGLADNIVFSIYEDNQHKLWISTYNGLSLYNPDTGHINNYTKLDGLPSSEFSVGAHYFFNNDELFLGTINGLMSFFPSEVENYRPQSEIVLSDMYIFDTKIEANKPFEKKIILEKPICETNSITIPANLNSLSFDVTDFNYSLPVRQAIKYKLEGWDSKWSPLPLNLRISFSNLPPGKYKLIIYSQSLDEKWKDKTLLDICIKPPFYASTIAIILYCMICIVLIIRIFLHLKKQNKLKRLLFEEDVQKKYQEQLFMTRMKFYTNVSHELRTPLTLILGMLDRINLQIDKQSPIIRQLEIAKRNAEKLHLLINDILDLRKIETGNMKVKKESKNIISFMQTLVSYFKEIADTQNIVIEFNHETDVLICLFDVDKTEKIIYNLLSNAIKYTTNRIIVTLGIKNREHETIIEISIKDNGHGIPPEDLEKIFSRFYQGENSVKTNGTGIGLNLALEMAKLQNGNIFVTSEKDVGSVFTLTLPIEIESIQTNIEILGNTEKPLVLVVDDNEDMIYYMTEILETEYNVYSANNGQLALDVAYKLVPDIMICDIMMPDISGIEVCKRIKSTPVTCHIAVILISARGSDQVRIDGLSLGADIYISKPFSEAYFMAQIKSILENRSILKEQIRQELIQTPQREIAQSPKDKMLQKIVHYIEQNLSNGEYDVEQLSNDMAMSRMSLYRKMKTCIGQTPSEFIREFRLRRAAELLQEGENNINEICYNTGFNDIKTFRLAFKKRFGMAPNEYKKCCSSQDGKRV